MLTAEHVLKARYLRRDREGRVAETPTELFARVARAVAEAERLEGNRDEAALWEERFFELMTSGSFLPNSPTLMNAGTPLGQLSACFVLPIEDSLEGIFETLTDAALVQRSGGGTGLSFSRLRPRGDRLESSGGSASGPVGFMKVFDCATENIQQGGRRRGANMGVLRYDHPDVLDFVQAKTEPGRLSTFNLSVAVDDAFLQAATRGERFALRHPTTGATVARMPATELLDVIVEAAWQTGDPGLLFLDALERANPTPALGALEATNPCGEVPLLPYESCTLGSINLAQMLTLHNGLLVVDWERLSAVARAAIRFLDDVLTVSRPPLPEIGRATQRTRKLGLGVMGFAELMARMGLQYDSDEAEKLAERIMDAIQEAALAASIRLAQERGPFEAWPDSTWARRGVRVRNATRTAVAPTGTIGMLAGTSASIEPFFALAYRRRVLDERVVEVNPLLLEAADARGLDVGALLAHLRERGSLSGLEDVPEDLRRIFRTAFEISADRHLRMAAAFQRHVDNAVSKTINLPQEATREEVRTAYLEAWRLGLKGVTVFRYGSRPAAILELGSGQEPEHLEHGTHCDPSECRV